MSLVVQNQTLKNSQNLLAVAIDSLQGFAEGRLEILCLHPLIHQRPRNIDILPQGLNGVPAQKQAIEECGLPLRG